MSWTKFTMSPGPCLWLYLEFLFFQSSLPHSRKTGTIKLILFVRKDTGSSYFTSIIACSETELAEKNNDKIGNVEKGTVDTAECVLSVWTAMACVLSRRQTVCHCFCAIRHEQEATGTRDGANLQQASRSSWLGSVLTLIGSVRFQSPLMNQLNLTGLNVRFWEICFPNRGDFGTL